MIGEVDISKQGGIDIQGIINQYQVEAGENINAGDFVEFINIYSTDADYQVNTTSNSGSQPVIAVALTNEKILVSSYTGKSLCLYTISGNTIIAGNLVSTGISAAYISNAVLKKISSNKVLIATQNDNGQINAKIATINNDTISLGTNALIKSSTNESVGSFDICLINENLFITSYGYGSAPKLRAIISSINDTTISPIANSDTTIINVNNTGAGVNIEHLTDNRYFATGRSTANIYGVIIEISDQNTISYISTNTNTAVSGGLISRTVKINDSKIACVFDYNSSYYLYGVIFSDTISGGNHVPTVGTKVDLHTIGGTSTNDYSLINSSNDKPILIKESTVFFPHSYDMSNKYLGATTFKVSGTSITNPSMAKLAQTTNGVVTCPLLTRDFLFIFHRSGTYNLNVYKYNISHKIKLLSQKIDGVAQEDGSGGATIDVVEPYAS